MVDQPVILVGPTLLQSVGSVPLSAVSVEYERVVCVCVCMCVSDISECTIFGMLRVFFPGVGAHCSVPPLTEFTRRSPG